MRRLHLFEFGDQEWIPRTAHNGGLEILRTFARLSGLTDDLAELLVDLADRTDTRRIVDLCSGAGGPTPYVLKAAADKGVELEGVLTDLYPDVETLNWAVEKSGGRLRIESNPVDATDVPDHLSGIRTIFNGLHHFRPDVVRKMLQDTASDGQPFLAVEFAGRSPSHLLSIASLAPVSLLLRPFIRPFNWKHWFYTYVIPFIPLGTLFDGMVSCLRVYNPDHLRELTEDIDGMSWEAGRIQSNNRFTGYLTYLIGIPEET